jgi:hypothetical protein
MNDIPETLRNYLDREANTHPEIVYRRRHAQGRLTASVHGSHVHVTVSLRRWWQAWMNLIPTDEQFCDAAEWLVGKLANGRKLLGLGAVVMFIYLAIEIGSAFLPSGAVERVLGGGR